METRHYHHHLPLITTLFKHHLLSFTAINNQAPDLQKTDLLHCYYSVCYEARCWVNLEDLASEGCSSSEPSLTLWQRNIP